MPEVCGDIRKTRIDKPILLVHDFSFVEPGRSIRGWVNVCDMLTSKKELSEDILMAALAQVSLIAETGFPHPQGRVGRYAGRERFTLGNLPEGETQLQLRASVIGEFKRGKGRAQVGAFLADGSYFGSGLIKFKDR